MDAMSAGTIRQWGFRPGFLEPGARNSITDVPGVKVGNWTLRDEKHNTGVTMIVPREDVYEHKCTAAAWVLNGYGKSAGIVQIQELGQLETPIALTNTLNVGLVSDALVEYTAQQCRRHGYELRSVNPVVGECNDAGLNTITERVAGYAQVMEALNGASEEFESGCAGAGAGMTCHDLKGGIGSASRRIRTDDGDFMLGVLALCNHGELRELSICGRHVGPAIEERLRNLPKKAPKEGDEGSCILVLACDLPLSSRQLGRVVKRCGVGLARCGSFWGHGSGDIVIGFTTAHDIRREEERTVLVQKIWNEDRLNDAFAAAAECSEEAVLNALSAAETTIGPDGRIRYALREFRELLSHGDADSGSFPEPQGC